MTPAAVRQAVVIRFGTVDPWAWEVSVRSRRMRRAMAMAVAGATITYAALEAGFSSPAHFRPISRRPSG